MPHPVFRNFNRWVLFAILVSTGPILNPLNGIKLNANRGFLKIDGCYSTHSRVAGVASPASPGAGLSFDIWPVLSGFHCSNSEKNWPNVKNRVEFQSRAGLRKVARATPGVGQEMVQNMLT